MLMPELTLLLMLLLVAGFLGTRVAAFLRLPHSVFLVVLGGLAGALVRSAGHHYDSYLGGLLPWLILYILLPPLVFESAYSLDSRQLRRDLLPIASLAIVAMTTSTLLVGYGLHYALNLALLPALTFGALISATDPVAVVALFKEVGAPKRLRHLIEAESLLNDGTAIVLFRVLLAMSLVQTAGPSAYGSVTAEFFRVAFGGLAVGALVAAICRLLLRFTAASASAQIGLTLAAAYVSFIVADAYLQVSGVIATMTLGVILGRTARLELNKVASASMAPLWAFFALSANIIVFFAVGFSVDPALLRQGASISLLTIVIVFLARALSVGTTIPLVNRLRLAEPISAAYQAVLIWGGLRGGLALGLVLMLPATFPSRDLFLTLAVSVVWSTLLLNAVTTKRVLHLLKLDRLDRQEANFYKRTLQLIHKTSLEPLRRAAAEGNLSLQLLQNRTPPTDDAASGSAGEEIDFRFSLSAWLGHEQRFYDDQLRDGALSRATYLRLSQTVQERADALQAGGRSLADAITLTFAAETALERRLRPLIHRLRPARMLLRLTDRLEFLLNLKFALDEAPAPSDASPRLRDLLQAWRSQVTEQINTFYDLYAHYGGAVQTFFIANALRASSERHITALFEVGVISLSVAQAARQTMIQDYRIAENEAWQRLRPSPAYLLARVAPFADFPRISVRKAADLATRRVVEPGEVVVRRGDRASAFFLVIGGTLEMQTGAPEDEPKPTRRLFTGEGFGAAALILEQPLAFTVVAVTTSELLELDRRSFHAIVDELPSLVQTAVARLAAAPETTGL